MARFTGSGDGPLDPAATPARLFIDGYGPGLFRIAGTQHDGSVVVLPDRVLAWMVTDAAAASAQSLAAYFELVGDIDLLLFGAGARMVPVPADLKRACAAAGVTVEPMDTGAAARTYNVLLAEDRRVSAALIAI